MYVIYGKMSDAVKNGDVEGVKEFLKEELDIYKDFDESLFHAVISENLEMVQFLIENGADVNIYRGACLNYAVKSKKIALIQLLLENGADTSLEKVRRVKVYAFLKGWTEIVKLLLK